MDYLHFIGRQYYSRAQFVKEATKYGVNRRIAPNVFKKMRMGDRVFLAQGDKRGSQIFGFFVFTRITGLSPELIDRLEQEEVISFSPSSFPATVTRGCGSYVISATYMVSSAEKLFETLKEMDSKQLGTLMIGGAYFELGNLFEPGSLAGHISNITPYIGHICTNIPFQQGFRPFDAEGFFTEYKRQIAQGRRNIRIIGMFYSKADPEAGHTAAGDVVKIQNYRRK